MLIDLKKNSVQYEDIGQMNMYIGYFATATYGMDSNLFVSKYELYLPNRKELEKLVNRILEDDDKGEVIT